MNVLVTRPDIRGKQLVELLEKENIFAIQQPLFTVEVGKELTQLPSILSRLKSGDYVFAVSKNAIDFATRTLSDTGFSWRGDLHYFAVGKMSAAYFAGKIGRAVRYPIVSETSEGLLDLPEMQILSDKNIVILRADTGRDYFANEAISRGAVVQSLECYRRIGLNDELKQRLSLSKRAGIDTIVVTSVEILNMLVEFTQKIDHDWLLNCKLIVVSPRIAKEAEKLGWMVDHIAISYNADNQSLLNTILNKE
ncbi:uroporphyrinogen-III synthase [Otariodibacter oris]|uniref:Uroporphyrinogen-III synthase n=1 Tax=Otariodibacter oris TaxID=1032623 RepID=A0A420XIZ8_9PAST|nr:uroporphyrinogen-III synthase [Otariodibacter oris]QGM80629.1 uroporphyrinogen-III synthase [Otariodibacter oris]RKR77213.1 uroporphyrinogen-III synthase [Otariodibacter oris]